MKICFIHYQMVYGGAENLIVDMINALKDKNDIYLYTLNDQ